MPELPDVAAYVTALERCGQGQILQGTQLRSPFLVRSFEPPLEAVHGRRIAGFRRVGKRVVWELEGDHYLVFHLMIAGRFHWRPAGSRPRTRAELLALHLPTGTVMVTEAGSARRASLFVVVGEQGLRAHDPGGLEVLESDAGTFAAALTRERHTLKRALTDPRLFSGIGNAYSDEILHAAGLSPVILTNRLCADQMARLHAAAVSVLGTWTDRLCAAARTQFPEKVTAFQEGMAVHGRFGQPCPACGTKVQRIEYASSETNYCPRCQTSGRLLADRALSRLLRGDWPRTIDELEERHLQ
jgi:formamidopyrimidine-DNA glycosylase